MANYATDLKSVGLNRSWGFESPRPHHRTFQYSSCSSDCLIITIISSPSFVQTSEDKQVRRIFYAGRFNNIKRKAYV